jgi:hypothetical protein
MPNGKLVTNGQASCDHISKTIYLMYCLPLEMMSFGKIHDNVRNCGVGTIVTGIMCCDYKPWLTLNGIKEKNCSINLPPFAAEPQVKPGQRWFLNMVMGQEKRGTRLMIRWLSNSRTVSTLPKPCFHSMTACGCWATAVVVIEVG